MATQNIIIVSNTPPPSEFTESVQNTAALAALGSPALVSGTVAYVSGVSGQSGSYYQLERASTLPQNGSSVVSAVGGGNWIRRDTVGTFAQQIPAWWIDPANGSDSNSGIASGSPLKTWKELVNRWGTEEPTINQNTTVTFLSSHIDNSDPIVFRPRLNGTSFIFQGTLTPIASTTLGTITAKNRSTGQFLNANIGQAVGPRVGLLLHNSTRSARCWVHADKGSNVAELTQPLSTPEVYSAGAAFLPPTEVDNFTAGDSCTLYQPAAINVVEVNPILTAFNQTTFGNQVVFQQCVIFDPNGPANDDFYIDYYVGFVECRLDRGMVAKATQPDSVSFLQNCWMRGGVSNCASQLTFWGGAIEFIANFSQSQGVELDADIIIIPGMTTGTGTNLGLVYIAGTMAVQGGSVIARQLNFGPPILWGSGSIAVGVEGKLYYPSTATSYFKQSGSMQINGGSTAFSITSAGVINGGITITPAHLDATAGSAGFGGSAFDPRSGCCITSLPAF